MPDFLLWLFCLYCLLKTSFPPIKPKKIPNYMLAVILTYTRQFVPNPSPILPNNWLVYAYSGSTHWSLIFLCIFYATNITWISLIYFHMCLNMRFISYLPLVLSVLLCLLSEVYFLFLRCVRIFLLYLCISQKSSHCQIRKSIQSLY